jgi:hypothetical protein
MNFPAICGRLTMSLQFHGVLDHIEIWSASDDGFSFVISHEDPAGPGFRGRPGYLASWRPLHGRTGAASITGSPFSTFTEAEEACNAMLTHLNERQRGSGI